MRLTLQTDYSLRVLMYLGVNRQRLATIREISDCYGISNNHLMKVVHQLGQLGYVEAIRGKNGGVRLGREPETISLGMLVRKVEPDMAIVECFMAENCCRVKPDCRLSGILSEALLAFLAVLDRYTLADLIAKPERLTSLLGLQPVNS